MLTGVAAFLLLLIALLVIPVTLIYQVQWRETFQGDITLQWLFGLIRLRLPVPQPKKPPSADKHRPKKVRYKKAKSISKSNPLVALRQKAFRQRIIRFIRDLWHAVHKRNICLRIHIGLSDPANTGRLWAFVGPVSAILANSQEVLIEIEPDFLDTTLELNSSGHIRVIPLQVLSLIIGLLLSPLFWQGMKQMRNAG